MGDSKPRLFLAEHRCGPTGPDLSSPSGSYSIRGRDSVSPQGIAKHVGCQVMDRNSTPVSRDNSNARGYMQPQQPKQGTPSLGTWDCLPGKMFQKCARTLHCGPCSD